MIFFPQSHEKQPRADATRNRELLLETARALFRREGVANVTMSAIAEAAGVGKGTLYRHFPDKAAICLALLDTEMHALQARVFDYLRQPYTPEEKLRWFLGEVAVYIHEHIDILSIDEAGAPHLALHQRAHAWWWQTIRGLLTQLSVAGDADYWADTLYIMLSVGTIRYQLYTRNYTLERICTGLQKVVDGVLSCPN